jgi:hypothetical protein
MASIGNVVLNIFEGPPATTPGSALIRVSYVITATHHDAEHEQAYRELVELVGDDRGEGGTAELIPDGKIWDGVVVFTTSQTSFTRIPEKTLPSSILDEDSSGPVIKEDEIRAVVTLIPIPPALLSRESNLVRRGGPVLDPGMTAKA